jgi:hypothetical protein
MATAAKRRGMGLSPEVIDVAKGERRRNKKKEHERDRGDEAPSGVELSSSAMSVAAPAGGAVSTTPAAAVWAEDLLAQLSEAGKATHARSARPSIVEDHLSTQRHLVASVAQELLALVQVALQRGDVSYAKSLLEMSDRLLKPATRTSSERELSTSSQASASAGFAREREMESEPRITLACEPRIGTGARAEPRAEYGRESERGGDLADVAVPTATTERGPVRINTDAAVASTVAFTNVAERLVPPTLGLTSDGKQTASGVKSGDVVDFLEAWHRYVEQACTLNRQPRRMFLCIERHLASVMWRHHAGVEHLTDAQRASITDEQTETMLRVLHLRPVADMGPDSIQFDSIATKIREQLVYDLRADHLPAMFNMERKLERLRDVEKWNGALAHKAAQRVVVEAVTDCLPRYQQEWVRHYLKLDVGKAVRDNVGLLFKYLCSPEFDRMVRQFKWAMDTNSATRKGSSRAARGGERESTEFAGATPTPDAGGSVMGPPGADTDPVRDKGARPVAPAVYTPMPALTAAASGGSQGGGKKPKAPPSEGCFFCAGAHWVHECTHPNWTAAKAKQLAACFRTTMDSSEVEKLARELGGRSPAPLQVRRLVQVPQREMMAQVRKTGADDEESGEDESEWESEEEESEEESEEEYETEDDEAERGRTAIRTVRFVSDTESDVDERSS